MKISRCLAVIPLEGRDAGVVFAGYAEKGVSAPYLVQSLMVGFAGAFG
jgi:hypothetical protein